jgi:hypothetical protein
MWGKMGELKAAFILECPGQKHSLTWWNFVHQQQDQLNDPEALLHCNDYWNAEFCGIFLSFILCVRTSLSPHVSSCI